MECGWFELLGFGAFGAAVAMIAEGMWVRYQRKKYLEDLDKKYLGNLDEDFDDPGVR